MSLTLRGLRTALSQGGIRFVFRNLLREGKLPAGVHVGTDEFGNKYYEDVDEDFPANRRVDFATNKWNASQIPGQWHQWIHYMTDDIPSTNKTHKWEMDHLENVTGTKEEYVPYSTTKPRIESWQPPKK